MTFKTLFPWIIILVLAYGLIKAKYKPTDLYEAPTITHSNPVPIILYDTVYVDNKPKVIIQENPVNTELLTKYKQAKDSITKLNLYKEAVTERTYKETFKDENQAITVTSKVIGTLQSQLVQYTAKKPSNGLYLGVGVGIDYRAFKLPQPEINISYLTGKEMYTIGANTQQIRLTYKRKIF